MSRSPNRRQFMQTSAASGVGLWAATGLGERNGTAAGGALPDTASGALAASGLAGRYWIDPSIAAWAPGAWRKAHIEFHTTRHIPRLGYQFDPDEFGETLVKAHVNAATVFAKDMFGYSYYPSKCGPMHPSLSFDLLGAQIAALRKRNIFVLAYYMTTWNPELAARRPDLLICPAGSAATKPRRTNASAEEIAYKPSSNAWRFCLGQEDFVKGELAHIRELVSQYELDGLWIDGAPPSAYCCDICRKMLAEKHLDPYTIHDDFLRRIRDVVKEARPKCLFCPQNQGSLGFAKRVGLIDYTDQEVLFNDSHDHGYWYFPAVVRYARGFGLPIYACTTRFNISWADFGGLKSPAQMKMEVASMVAQCVRCDIGDQVPPSGRLDPAVYNVIGQAYAHVERLEPYLEQAAPVTEAALLTTGQFPGSETNYGWIKLLLESHVQFDIVDPEAKWDRYALVVLPETLPVSQALANRLHAYIAGGGAVLVAHKAGLLAGTEKSWLERYGLHYAGKSPFAPAYMVPKVNFTREIPSYEYALYEGASQWRAESPATTLAVLGEPLFQRSPQHFTSHRQTPFDHATSYSALALSGRVALLAFPLGQSYYHQNYWIYRQAFQKLLGDVLPAPLLQTDAHSTTEFSLTHQAARADIGRKERYMVHIVNFSPVRRNAAGRLAGSAERPSPSDAPLPYWPSDYCDDPVPLRDVMVRVNLPLKTSTARALVGGEDLPVRRAAGGGIEVVVPRVDIHEVLSLESF